MKFLHLSQPALTEIDYNFQFEHSYIFPEERDHQDNRVLRLEILLIFLLNDW